MAPGMALFETLSVTCPVKVPFSTASAGTGSNPRRKIDVTKTRRIRPIDDREDIPFLNMAVSLLMLF
jgi:hypothetical protein